MICIKSNKQTYFEDYLDLSITNLKGSIHTELHHQVSTNTNYKLSNPATFPPQVPSPTTLASHTIGVAGSKHTILNRADQVYLHACPKHIRHTLWLESCGNRA